MTLIERDPRVEFVFLARGLRPTTPGRPYLDVTELGLHDLIVPGAFPATIRIGLVARLQWKPEDRDKTFHISYAARAWKASSPQPALTGTFEVDLTAGHPSPYPHHESGLMPAQFGTALEITFTGYGTYVVDVLLDGDVIASAPFAVLPPSGPGSS